MEPVSFLGSTPTHVELIDDSHFATTIGCNLAIASIADPTHFEFFEGHSKVISSFAISPDRKLIATGQSGPESHTESTVPIIIWDIPSRSQKLVLRGQNGAINKMVFSNDGRILAVTDTKTCKVWIWDIVEQDLALFIGTKYVPSTIAFSENSKNKWDLHVSVDRITTKYTIVFDPRTFEFHQTSQPYANPNSGYFRTYNSSASLRPNYIVGAQSGDLGIYNTDSCTIRCILDVDQYPIDSIAFTDDPGTALVGGQSLSIVSGNDTKWTVKKQVTLSAPVCHISVYGNHALVRTTDTSIFYIDIPSLRARKIVKGTVSKCLRIASTAKTVAVALGEGGLTLVSVSSQKLEFVEHIPSLKATSVCALPNDTFVAGLSDGRIACVNEIGKTLWSTEHIHRGAVTAVMATRDFIATGGQDGFIRTLTHQTRSIVNEVPVHSAAVCEIIAAVGHPEWVHSCGEDRTMTTTEVSTGKRICQQILSGRIGYHSLQQLRDGETEVLVGMGDGSVIGYDWPRKGIVLEEKAPYELQINTIALNPKDRRLAAGGECEYIMMCNFASTGAWTVSAAAHSTPVRSLVWTPDGRTLLSAADDGLCMWCVH